MILFLTLSPPPSQGDGSDLNRAWKRARGQIGGGAGGNVGSGHALFLEMVAFVDSEELFPSLTLCPCL